jgi:DNA-binding CsgD family transcriptional regulator
MREYDAAIASLAGAALSAVGWRDALRDIALAVGGRRLAFLLLSDVGGSCFERIDFRAGGDRDDPDHSQSLNEKPAAWGRFYDRAPQDMSVALAPETALDEMFRAMLDTRGATDGLVNQGAVAAAIIRTREVQGVLAVCAEPDEAGFTAYDVKMLRRLHPMIQCVAGNYAAIGAVRSSLAICTDLLDQLPFGVAILDGAGHLIATNQTADRLLDDDSVLTVRGGGLACTDKEEDLALQQAMHLAAEGEEEGGLVLKFYGDEGVQPWSLTISPVVGENAADALAWGRNRPRLVVCVSDRQPITELPAGQVAAAFGLSQQEEALAARLATGASLAEIATQSRRSVETLRTQLRAIFQKAEISSQAQLVQLVLSAPVGPLVIGDRAAPRPHSAIVKAASRVVALGDEARRRAAADRLRKDPGLAGA